MYISDLHDEDLEIAIKVKTKVQLLTTYLLQRRQCRNLGVSKQICSQTNHSLKNLLQILKANIFFRLDLNKKSEPQPKNTKAQKNILKPIGSKSARSKAPKIRSKYNESECTSKTIFVLIKIRFYVHLIFGILILAAFDHMHTYSFSCSDNLWFGFRPFSKIHSVICLYVLTVALKP